MPPPAAALVPHVANLMTGQATLTVRGCLAHGTFLEGTAVIRVLDKNAPKE